jgi:hypothetical protein
MTFTRTYSNRSVVLHSSIPQEWKVGHDTFTLPDQYSAEWLRYSSVLAVIKDKIMIAFLRFTYSEANVFIDPMTMWDMDRETLEAFSELADVLHG